MWKITRRRFPGTGLPVSTATKSFTVIITKLGSPLYSTVTLLAPFRGTSTVDAAQHRDVVATICSGARVGLEFSR